MNNNKKRVLLITKIIFIQNPVLMAVDYKCTGNTSISNEYLRITIFLTDE